jgi:hypothetical protein
MDGGRLDTLARILATKESRREALRRLAAGAAGGLAAGGWLSRTATAADACVDFCLQIPPGAARGQCIADASHEAGLCYECGPAAPAGTTDELCGSACVDVNNDPLNCGGCDQGCDPGEPCVNGACGCPPFQAYCESSQSCVSTFCGRFRTVYDPDTCQCECESQFIRLPGGGCGIPCITDADCADSQFCATSADGYLVCMGQGSYLPFCTPCETDYDCYNFDTGTGCSAISALCLVAGSGPTFPGVPFPYCNQAA